MAASAVINVPAPASTTVAYYRHRWPVRLMHWINVLSLAILLISGLQIFNAYPHLHWGKSSYNGAPPLLSIEARDAPDSSMSGVVRVLGLSSTRRACWARAAMPTENG